VIIKFIGYRGDGDARTYFEQKWRSASGISAAYAYELSFQALESAAKASDPWEFLGPPGLPKHEAMHRIAAIRIADAAMPLLQGETMIEPDGFDVTGAEAFGIAKGTLCLRRRTTHSDMLYFYPCTQVVDGVLYRGLAHDADDEAVLISMDAPAPGSVPEPPAQVDTAAEPTLMATIASTIVHGILSSLSGRAGMRAIDFAFESLGIPNPLEAADDSYEQLVKALRMQSRADFRRQIALRLRAFERLREDYRGGMRTKDKLDSIYNEIRQLTSWIEVDERSPDRVHLLAFTQAIYLSVMQEMAEWHRKDDPELMKSFYAAMTQRAASEAAVLIKVQQEAYDQRLAKITGLHDSFDFTFTSNRIISYDDAVWRETGDDKPLEDQWRRAEISCVDRNFQTGVCNRWVFTPKGKEKIAEMEAILQRYRQRIRSDLDKALNGIPQAIANFQQIAKMTVPPPPPK
jgi:hypothetical protein